MSSGGGRPACSSLSPTTSGVHQLRFPGTPRWRGRVPAPSVPHPRCRWRPPWLTWVDRVPPPGTAG